MENQYLGGNGNVDGNTYGNNNPNSNFNQGHGQGMMHPLFNPYAAMDPLFMGMGGMPMNPGKKN